mgnify:FL=1
MAISYYRIIDGKRYDRRMLRVADEAVGKEDGQIGMDSARKLFRIVTEGNRITRLEKDTLNYIKDNYRFSAEAMAWLFQRLENWKTRRNRRLTLFGLFDQSPAHTAPIIPPTSSPSRLKKWWRLLTEPRPSRSKVTVDIKSLNRKAEEIAQKEAEEAAMDPPEVIEQTEVEIPSATVPAKEESAAEKDEVIIEDTMEETEGGKEAVQASSRRLTRSKGSTSPSSEPRSVRTAPPKTSGQRQEPKEKEVKRKQYPDTESATSKPSTQAPVPAKAPSNTRWRLIAVICVLLIPMAFFIGINLPVTEEEKRVSTVQDDTDDLPQEDLVNRLTLENEVLKQNLDKLSDLNKALAEESPDGDSQLANRIDTLVTELRASEEEMVRLRLENEQLVKRLASVSQHPEADQKVQVAEGEPAKTAGTEELISRIENQEQQIELLQAENKVLKDSLEDSTGLKKQIEQSTDDAQLIEQIDQLSARLRKRDLTIAKLSKEVQSLKQQLKRTTTPAVVQPTPEQIKTAETKRKIATALTDRLNAEFAENLVKFDKERLWITFMPSESYFDVGSAQLNPSLQKALRQFFPDFVKTLISFEKEVSEIRFQGHTSSAWVSAKDPAEAYLKNMSLSTERAESALRFCLGLEEVAPYREWLTERMVSSGFSDQHPVMTDDKTEDRVRSRRITISVGIAAPADE